jgi:hypothetical protein
MGVMNIVDIEDYSVSCACGGGRGSRGKEERIEREEKKHKVGERKESGARDS